MGRQLTPEEEDVINRRVAAMSAINREDKERRDAEEARQAVRDAQENIVGGVVYGVVHFEF